MVHIAFRITGEGFCAAGGDGFGRRFRPPPLVRPKRLELPPLGDQILSLARLPIPPRSLIGDPSEIRTPDTLIKSQVLYRLS